MFSSSLVAGGVHRLNAKGLAAATGGVLASPPAAAAAAAAASAATGGEAAGGEPASASASAPGEPAAFAAARRCFCACFLRSRRLLLGRLHLGALRLAWRTSLRHRRRRRLLVSRLRLCRRLGLGLGHRSLDRRPLGRLPLGLLGVLLALAAAPAELLAQPLPSSLLLLLGHAAR